MSVPVTVDNFTRAESDLYFSNVVKDGGFGKLFHIREPQPLEHQTVIRMNRDTLYSSAVIDLDAGPVTVTLPDAGKRFRSMQVINEDEYTLQVAYEAGSYRFSRGDVGTRYVIFAIRTLVDPNVKGDLEAVHALQDATLVDQPGGPGKFEVPSWDPVSQKTVRDALLVLGATLANSKDAFGRKEDVDPVHFLVASALAWGGNPAKEATYLNFTLADNDGKSVHRVTVGNVPVDGFWSITVYNAQGYFEKNDRDVYSVNNLSAVKDPDGSITIQFGGCDAGSATLNCIPVMPGWNYIVRLYRPRAEILNGSWKFPDAVKIG
jgi:hypothetical protein